jgi:sensor c-di-GMP phosphodiesterase-like protein
VGLSLSSRRKLFVAIGIGIVLSGPPVAAINLWLGSIAEQQGVEELELSARRHMALSEARIAQTVETLDSVAARNIDSCRPGHIDALRQMTFVTTPIKELSIVAPDGRTLCTDVGSQPEQRTVVASEPLSKNSPVLLEVVRLGARPEQWIRIRRPGVDGANGVAALMPAVLFVPQVSTRGNTPKFYARMMMAGGTPIAESGQPAAAEQHDKVLTVDDDSDRYALKAFVSSPRSAVLANSSDLQAMGIVASGLLAILILTLSMLLPKRERDNPIAEIERALLANEFVPYFQPIVDIRTGRLRGAEVLIRWRKGNGTIEPPSSFIALAESSGLILDLTRYLMRRVCQEAGPVLGLRPHLKVGFNLTARHFTNEEIVDDVRDIFRKSPLRLSQIVFEVTERQPMENLTETRRIVAALQGLGALVAIDDVGTGHSGLSYMLKLGVDIIKIDKMFIDALGTDRNSNTIIGTLIDLAQNMRMDVVAEGVESFEQVVHLRELGVRAAQGFVFSPPLPCSAFLELVEAIDPIKPAAASSETPAGSFAAVAQTEAA